MKENSFSILIPAYKTKYLKEAIRSCLNQTYEKYEVVVVDDCSPYDIKSIVDFYTDNRIKYYRNETNCGSIDVVNNWNICLSYSSGDYIICIGDDDRLLPNCLKDVNELINNYPNLDVYHLQTQIIDEEGRVVKNLELRPEFESAAEMLYQRFAGRSQYIGDFCFYSKTLKEEGGFFYLPMAWTSDDVTAYRAALPNGIANTQTVCFEYRENQYSITENSSNDMIKIKALEMSKQWYLEQFESFYCDGKNKEDNINKLRTAMLTHYGLMFGKHIYNDLKISRLRIFYWFMNCRRYHVPYNVLCKLFVKSLSDN